jgi:hypothetical protein
MDLTASSHSNTATTKTILPIELMYIHLLQWHDFLRDAPLDFQGGLRKFKKKFNPPSGKEKKNSPTKWVRKKINPPKAQNQNVCVFRKKNHPQACRKKKITTQPGMKKKINIKPNFLTPPGNLMVRP